MKIFSRLPSHTIARIFNFETAKILFRMGNRADKIITLIFVNEIDTDNYRTSHQLTNRMANREEGSIYFDEICFNN
jgi:hypothetical protein